MAITLRIWVHVEAVTVSDIACPDCGYDALIEYRVYLLSPGGVDARPHQTRCGRCAAETQRLGG